MRGSVCVPAGAVDKSELYIGRRRSVGSVIVAATAGVSGGESVKNNVGRVSVAGECSHTMRGKERGKVVTGGIVHGSDSGAGEI